jgi:glyoxylase-like metal-dependent hydrolase (beta-lactamase superfamily II)
MLLVDAAMPHNGSRIINYIKRIGENPSNLKLIVLTHADLDHIGSAAELKQMTGAKLAIHSEDSPILSGKVGMKIVKGPLGLLFKLMYPLVRFHPIEPDIILKDDMDVAGFKVVHVPGHTSGSICLYQPSKIIFVGDTFRSDSAGNPKLSSKALAIKVEQFQASQRIISELDFDILLPGHGFPVIGGASANVKKLFIDLTPDNQNPIIKTQ